MFSLNLGNLWRRHWQIHEVVPKSLACPFDSMSHYERYQFYSALSDKVLPAQHQKPHPPTGWSGSHHWPWLMLLASYGHHHWVQLSHPSHQHTQKLACSGLARILSSLAVKFQRHTSTQHDPSFSSPYMLVVTTSLKNTHQTQQSHELILYAPWSSSD